MKDRRFRRPVLLAAGALLVLVPAAAGCGSSRSSKASAGSICPPAQQEPLLAGVLTHLTPSASFRLASGRTAWAVTSNRPDQDQLFSSVGGIARLAVVRAGGAADPSSDPAVTLRHSDEWVALPVGPGDWQVYTDNLGISLGIRVVSCPSGG